jgi:adenylate cyclase class IV
MGKEYEVAFININQKKIKDKIKALRGKLVSKKTLMPIQYFTLPDRCTYRKNNNDGKRIKQVLEKSHKGGYGRVRHEGKQITMTIKKFHKKKKSFPEEYEVEIDSMDEGINFLLACGFVKQQFEEKYRETWNFPSSGCKELVFDTWPGLNTFIEIDCESKEKLEATVKKLGLNMSDAIYGGVDAIYDLVYGIKDDVFHEQGSSLDFYNVKKRLSKHVEKNKKLFNEVAKKHKKLKSYVKSKKMIKK